MKIIPTVLMVAYTCGACAQNENTEALPASTGHQYAVKAYASALFTPYNYDGYQNHTITKA